MVFGNIKSVIMTINICKAYTSDDLSVTCPFFFVFYEKFAVNTFSLLFSKIGKNSVNNCRRFVLHQSGCVFTKLRNNLNLYRMYLCFHFGLLTSGHVGFEGGRKKMVPGV